MPAVRAAARQAMRILGSHFVLGETIEQALVARAFRRGRAVSLFVRHAGRGRAHRRRRRSATCIPMPSAIDAIGKAAGKRAPARAARHLGQTFGAASALRGDQPRARAARAGARRDRACAPGQAFRSQFHGRCRRGRPAGIVDGCYRAGDGGSVARRLGRLWPRHPGLSKARRRGDRLCRELWREAHRPQSDGAPGQGRLLGHRDQARAGARPRRLSGVHPQGDDRPELPRLRAQIAGASAAALSAIRHP